MGLISFSSSFQILRKTFKWDFFAEHLLSKSACRKMSSDTIKITNLRKNILPEMLIKLWLTLNKFLFEQMKHQSRPSFEL